MPRLPIDHLNTIIYKIVCNDLNITDTYVGHTTDFTKRKYRHKSACNNTKNKEKIYRFIRENGGWDNFTMVELEKFPCNSANEARKREREWYDMLNSKLNTNRPCLKPEELLNYHKNYHKKYKIDNGDKIRARDKQYYLDNGEAKRAKMKQYRLDHLDKMRAYQKIYRLDKKNKKLI
jgi:hypothetical protein